MTGKLDEMLENRFGGAIADRKTFSPLGEVILENQHMGFFSRANRSLRICTNEIDSHKITKLLRFLPKIRRRSTSVRLRLGLSLLTRVAPWVLREVRHKMISAGSLGFEIPDVEVIGSIPNQRRTVIITTHFADLGFRVFLRIRLILLSLFSRLTLLLRLLPFDLNQINRDLRVFITIHGSRSRI